jgi:hypothetical protein
VIAKIYGTVVDKVKLYGVEQVAFVRCLFLLGEKETGHVHQSYSFSQTSPDQLSPVYFAILTDRCSCYRYQSTCNVYYPTDLKVWMCRELHQQPLVRDLIGEYRSDERDPSATMINIALRGFDEERMRKACQLMDRGKGLKAAAAEVC